MCENIAFYTLRPRYIFPKVFHEWVSNVAIYGESWTYQVLVPSLNAGCVVGVLCVCVGGGVCGGVVVWGMWCGVGGGVEYVGGWVGGGRGIRKVYICSC